MNTQWYDLAKVRMKELGISQEQLAEHLEVTQGAVGHWLNGRRSPPLIFIMQLMKAIGYSAVEFAPDGRVISYEKTTPLIAGFVSFDTVGNRLLFILSAEQITQKDLAQKLSVSPQTINNWIRRDSVGTIAAQQICQEFGYSLEWLLTGSGSPKPDLTKNENSSIPPQEEWSAVSTWDRETPLDDDEVEVPFLKDIEFACGDGGVVNIDYNGYKLRFSKSTLRKIGAPTDGSTIVCFPAKGNSMEPVIPDGAAVAIDVANKRIKDGAIYAIEQGDLKRIKCLYRKPDRKLLIRSFNRDEHEDEITDERNVKIIGKLFWHSVLHY